MSANEGKISLKLMVHKEKNKVAFAEADNNFVETLFSIMTLPMATIVRLLDKCPDQNLQGLGSLKNLYQSLVELSACYFSKKESRFMMLNPRTSGYDSCRKLKLNIDDTEPTKYFICEKEDCNVPLYRNASLYYSTSSFATCPSCCKLMTREAVNNNPFVCWRKFNQFRSDDDDPGVFVPSLTTFLVTDDLWVMPDTLDSSIRLLCDLGFTDASQLEERTIDICHEQMVILVKAAISSRYPLTYLVFHSFHPGGLVNPKPGSWIQHLTSNEKDTKPKTMTLKLNLQKSTSKFLFAEAEEDFVDFLFGFLEIPLGTLIGKLMNGNSSFECLDNLFASISKMSVGRCIKSQTLKDLLIQPQLRRKYVSVNQIFPLDASKDFGIYLGNRQRELKDPRVKGRFLKSPTKFMLMDDLVLTPLSSVSGISMLNKLKVPLNDVEHHAVCIDIDKGLRILNASLTSKSTFTDALLEEIIESKRKDAVQELVILLKS